MVVEEEEEEVGCLEWRGEEKLLAGVWLAWLRELRVRGIETEGGEGEEAVVRNQLHFGPPRTQPPTVVCKMGAQSEHVHVAYTFFCTLGCQCACSVGDY